MKNKRSLIISGGGAKGAWGVGIAQGLVQHKGLTYDTVIGTSTGSLMGPLILDNQWEPLINAYTTITPDQIFNINPFKSDGRIRALAVGWRIITGKQSIGETKALKDTIRRYLTVETFNSLRNSDKIFGATVTNLNTGQSKVKLLHEGSYNDIVDWIWASANQPVFMSILKKDNASWVDGGLKDFVSIKYILDNRLADEIDVIIHNTPLMTEYQNINDQGALAILLRTIGIFSADVALNDIATAQLQVQLDKSALINFYFMSLEQTALFPNSLLFDAAIMRKVYQQGLDSVINDTCTVEHCLITTDGRIISAHP